MMVSGEDEEEEEAVHPAGVFSRFPAGCPVKPPGGWEALFPGKTEGDVIRSCRE